MSRNTFRTAVAATAMAPMIALGTGAATAAPAVPTAPAPVAEFVQPAVLGPLGVVCVPLIFVPVVGVPLFVVCLV